MNVPGTASFRKVPHPCKHALFQPLLRNNPMLKMRFFLNKSSPYWIIITPNSVEYPLPLPLSPFRALHIFAFRQQAIGSYYHFLIRYLSQKIMPDMLALIDFYLHKQRPTIARRLEKVFHTTNVYVLSSGIIRARQLINNYVSRMEFKVS